jgi:hypothetical protein
MINVQFVIIKEIGILRMVVLKVVLVPYSQIKMY